VKKVLILLLFLQLSVLIFGQTDKKHKDDNVELIKSRFFFTPSFVNEDNLLVISNISNDRKLIYYKPNINKSIGLTFGIHRASFSFSIKLPKDDYLGKTKVRRFGFNYQMRHFGFSIFYNRYEGVLLENYADFGIPDNNNTFRQDVTLWYMGFDTKYIFNNRFSINAATKQTMRQKSSAGSFMFLVGNTFYGFDADSSFIVGGEQQYYPTSTGINNVYTSSIKFIPGAGYSFIFGERKRFSFTTTLFTGFDLQIKFYQQDYDNRVGVSLPFYLKSTSIFGYNGEYYYSNFTYLFELNRTAFDDARFDLFINYFRFSIGRRIFAKK
jgi:hypothetical protein